MDEEWISITDAANRLTAMGDVVDRSTLSRYLKQHAEALPLKPHGKFNLVGFSALSAHRGENIRLRRPIGPGVGPIASARRSSGATQFPGTQLDGAARKTVADARRASADAEMREMELALRRKQLVPVAEVHQAAHEAVATMRASFDRAIEAVAQEAALKFGWDERQARITLKKLASIGLTSFNRVILETLEAMQHQERDPGEPASSSLQVDAENGA